MAEQQDTIHVLESHKTLLEERDALLKRARTIAAQYNTVVPIAKLPAEILLRIFSKNMSSSDGVPSYRESSRRIDPSRDVRRASQVCHYWRELVLGSPTLWTLLLNCNFTPPLWAKELVRRSRTLPLKVTINFFSAHIRRGATNFRTALPQFDRLGELEAFCGDIKNVKAILFKRLQQPMPMLRALTLSSGDYEAEERDDLDDLESFTSDTSNFEAMLRDRNPYLPPFPFEDTFKLLRLKTSGYIFPLDSPLYHHLVQLSVFNINGKVPKISEWCTLIQTLGNLTSLTLVDAFSRADDAEPMLDMELPHLIYLRVAGPFVPCSHFLLHITAPPLDVFDLRIRSVDFRSSLGNSLMQNILNHLIRQRQVTSPQSLRAIVSKKSVTVTDFDADRNVPFLFQVHLGYSQMESREFCGSLMPALDSRISAEPFGNLDYEGKFPPIMIQALMVLMSPYASIENFSIKFELWGVFLMPLLKGFVGDTDGTPPMFPLSLPQIQYVTIRAMPWNSSNACNALYKFVNWRAESKKPLDTIHFKYSDINSTPTVPDACTVLEPFCTKLVWEGRRNRYRNHRRYTSDLDSDDSMNEGLYGDDDDLVW